MNTTGNTYGNGYEASGERRETMRGLADMNALSLALSDVLSTPSMQTNEISRDGNSQVGVSDMDSVTTTGDSASTTSSLSRRTPRRHSLSYSGLHGSAQNQQTRVTGQVTDNTTSSSFGTMLNDNSNTLSRHRSLRQQPTFQSDGGQSALSLGLGLQMNHTGNTGGSMRPRYMPPATQSVQVGIITTVPATNPAPSDQTTRDDRSVDTWGEVSNRSILSWQSRGSNILGVPLRNLASHAGGGSVPVDENWGPIFPPQMMITATANPVSADERNGNDRVHNDGDGFRVVRESDEERTPVSRFSRTLPDASGAITTNGGGGGRSPSHQGPPTSSDNRDRDRNREQERRDRRRDRRQSQAAPITPSHTADVAGFTQTAEYTSEQSRGHNQYRTPAQYPDLSSSLLLQPANVTSSNLQSQSEGQSQPPTESRRSRRR
ncbi:hypothetical protein AGABI1DRAFT_115030, partial [Agaricus bisporus var. burnettii JB137-S8]